LDYAGDPEDRKSTSRYIILMGMDPICWQSKKKKKNKKVAKSIVEVE